MKNLHRPSSHGPIGDSMNKDQTKKKEVQKKKGQFNLTFSPSLMKPCGSVVSDCWTGKAALSQSQLVPVLGLVPLQERAAVPAWHSCAATGLSTGQLLSQPCRAPALPRASTRQGRAELPGTLELPKLER